MTQSVDCDFYLYDSCLVYTGNAVKLIENNLNRNCSFGEGKTKVINFGTKRKSKSDAYTD